MSGESLCLVMTDPALRLPMVLAVPVPGELLHDARGFSRVEIKGLAELPTGLDAGELAAGPDAVRQLLVDEESERAGQEVPEEALRQCAEPGRRGVATERATEILDRTAEE